MEDAIKILYILNHYGEAYIVGGAVRDHLLNRECHDIDIATNVGMEVIEKLFETIDIGKNKEFGICVVRYNDKTYEVANFRSDGISSDNRHPDTIAFVSTLEEDVKRRDFTINGLGMDIDGNIMDYVGGEKDIRDNMLRCIGNANERFQEDYLRMLRAVRFSSTLNFKICPDMLQALFNHSHKINSISTERIQQELWKMASQTGKNFALAITLLKKTTLLQYILPEIDCMDEYEHTPSHHPEGGVFDHTLAALCKYEGCDPVINFSILLHDVGKPLCRTYEEGVIRYKLHARVGVEVAEKVCDRLKFSNNTKETILFCVENHMKFHDFLDMSNNKIIKLIMDKNWEALYRVGFVDDICRGITDNSFWEKIYRKIEILKIKFVENNRYEKLKKKINGDFIMLHSGLEQGPKIGQIQKAIMDFILDSDLDIDDCSVMEKIKNTLKKQVNR